MRVLVTGGSGRIGQFTVAELLAHGHEVVMSDRRRSPAWRDLPHGAVAGAEWRELDVTDVGAVTWAMRGCDAVVHLGAIPAPRTQPDHVVYHNNVMGTWAMFEAAESLGVRRVAQASSISAYGTAWSDTPRSFRYVPVDEGHPMENADCYGLSKEVAELTAATFHRRTGMQVVSLRYSYVGSPGEIGDRRTSYDADLADNTKTLWAYVDVRDAARANRMAIEADGVGCVAVNITAAETLSSVPTAELLREHLPDVEVRRPIDGYATAFDLSWARETIGWEPVYRWRDLSR